MSRWYEVFDNDEVLFRTKRQLGFLYGMLTLVLFALLTLLLYLAEQDDRLSTASLYSLGLLLANLGLLLRRLHRLKKVVWCVKISPEQIVGYDHSRQKKVLPWSDITAVNLERRGLSLLMHRRRVLFIPHVFKDFHVLSHRIVDEAEHRGIPVLIHGRPLEEVDIHDLYPHLMSDRLSSADL